MCFGCDMVYSSHLRSSCPLQEAKMKCLQGTWWLNMKRRHTLKFLGFLNDVIHNITSRDGIITCDRMAKRLWNRLLSAKQVKISEYSEIQIGEHKRRQPQKMRRLRRGQIYVGNVPVASTQGRRVYVPTVDFVAYTLCLITHQLSFILQEDEQQLQQ